MTLETYHRHQLQYLNGLASSLSSLSAGLSHLLRIYTRKALEGKRNAKMELSWKLYTDPSHQMGLVHCISIILFIFPRHAYASM